MSRKSLYVDLDAEPEPLGIHPPQTPRKQTRKNTIRDWFLNKASTPPKVQHQMATRKRTAREEAYIQHIDRLLTLHHTMTNAYNQFTQAFREAVKSYTPELAGHMYENEQIDNEDDSTSEGELIDDGETIGSSSDGERQQHDDGEDDSCIVDDNAPLSYDSDASVVEVDKPPHSLVLTNSSSDNDEEKKFLKRKLKSQRKIDEDDDDDSVVLDDEDAKAVETIDELSQHS